MATTEKENVEKSLEALKSKKKELTLMVKLFQMGYSTEEPIPSLKEMQQELSTITDPPTRELFCEKYTLSMELQETKREHCEMVKKVKSRGVDKNSKVKQINYVIFYSVMGR